jgi:heme A synthase
MINILFTLVIVAIVCGLIWWAADALPITGPFNRIVKVLAVVIFVVVAIAILMQLMNVQLVGIQ